MSELDPNLPERLERDLFRIRFELQGADFDEALDALKRAHPEHAHRLDEVAATIGAGERLVKGNLIDPAAMPERIGPYRLLEKLGSGGMGTVYKAEQNEPLHRLVAVKVVKLGMDTKQVLARFDLERRALATMDHRCVAKVLDAGTTERGQPYFVMELVDGLPITEYSDTHRLTIPERLRLFGQVCAGVQHAHQKGVIHRDLKPSNVLVTTEDDEPVPKIVDFGLAKATDRELLAHSIETLADATLGTPEYMAPEQAEGDPDRIDSRADVYSLGVVLYELLAGDLPFPSELLRRTARDAVRRVLVDDDPPKPSSKIATGTELDTLRALRRRVSQHAWARQLRGDLDWIVMKCLAKDPARRYPTPSGLAMDLNRHLEHEPVVAGPPSASYRLAKLARRYRAQLLGAAVVFVTAVIGAIVAVDYALAAEESAELARARAGAIERTADVFENVARVDAIRAEAATLYPAWPETVPGFEDCLQRIAELSAKLPALRAIAPSEAPEGSPEARAERFLLDTVQRLIPNIERLAATTGAEVQRRLDWARQVDRLTVAHPGARFSWEQARDAVRASELYADAPIPDLRVQQSLVPLGPNPVTGLWEFYHLRSAWDGTSDPETIVIPEHDDEGRIAVGDDTGIVFVLVPGGRFTIGAQAEDRDLPHYDPEAEPRESPLHEVTLAPFLLARHELTQGQWSRLADGGLSLTSSLGWGNSIGGYITLAHPADIVSWGDCDLLLTRHVLTLPTEAQWEYACRAGSSTRWHTGDDPHSLLGYENVLDETTRRLDPLRGGKVYFDDGYFIHAPVGLLLPNAWGLHDLHGNVGEWCRERYDSYEFPVRDGDGLRLVPDRPNAEFPLSAHIVRGGGHNRPARYARSAWRGTTQPFVRMGNLGCRAARAILE